MNSIIKNYLTTQKSKIENLNEKENQIYKSGIGIIGCLICEDFFDIPHLPSNKYGTD